MNALRVIPLVLMAYTSDDADPRPSFAIVPVNTALLEKIEQAHPLIEQHNLASVALFADVTWIDVSANDDDALAIHPVNDRLHIDRHTVHWTAIEKHCDTCFESGPVSLTWLREQFAKALASGADRLQSTDDDRLDPAVESALRHWQAN